MRKLDIELAVIVRRSGLIGMTLQQLRFMHSRPHALLEQAPDPLRIVRRQLLDAIGENHQIVCVERRDFVVHSVLAIGFGRFGYVGYLSASKEFNRNTFEYHVAFSRSFLFLSSGPAIMRR